MTRIIVLLLSALCAVHSLRVMSFNIWSSGRNVYDGGMKVANHILKVNPDIVALQELIEYDDAVKLVKNLNNRGGGWSMVARCKGVDSRANAILTKHIIVGGYTHTKWGMNTMIKLRNNGQEISVWSMHLEWRDIGLEAVLRGETNEQILDGEINNHPSRIDNIVELFKTPEFVRQIKNSNNVPVIVAGDFNTASDLDYIESTKNSHEGYVIEWPVTKLIREAAGMTDSYREVYPDPKTHPGNTWPVHDYDKDTGNRAIKERIDYIFYRGQLRAYASETYKGTDELVLGRNGDSKINAYPSDHYAVITDFEQVSYKYEKVPTFAHQYKDNVPLMKESCPLIIIQ